MSSIVWVQMKSKQSDNKGKQGNKKSSESRSRKNPRPKKSVSDSLLNCSNVENNWEVSNEGEGAMYSLEPEIIVENETIEVHDNNDMNPTVDSSMASRTAY